jgi:hypothetical protein
VPMRRVGLAVVLGVSLILARCASWDHPDHPSCAV